MKKILYFILCLVIFGCSENYSTEDGLTPSLVTRYLSISQTSISVDAEYHLIDIYIVSDDTPWSIANSCDWMSVSPLSGDTDVTVSAEIMENREAETTRSNVFYFQAEVSDWAYEKAISVTQAGPEPSLEVSKSSLSFSGVGGTESVTFTTNCKKIELSCSNDWITASQDGNSITVSVADNLSASYRSGYVSVKYFGEESSGSANINIEQAPADITADTEPLVFENVASVAEIKINSEQEWSATTSDTWIETDPTEGPRGESVMKISVAPNTSINERNGYVAIKIGTAERVQIPIRQRGIYIEADTEQLNFISTGEKLEVGIQSNTTWTVTSYPEWISVSPSEGQGSMTISLTAEDNPSTSSRIGILKIGQAGLDLSVDITLTQSGKSFEVGTTVLNFNDKSATQSLDIKTDGTWTAESQNDWISVSPTSATGDSKLDITVSENTLYEERIGTVKITMAEKTATVNVVQNGKYFTVTDDNLSLTSKGGQVKLSVSTNDAWTAFAENSPAWLSLDKTSGDGDAEITITVIDNPSVNSRTAYVVVETVNHQSVRFIISQAARYLRVDTQEILIYAKGGTSEPVTVNTDGTFSVTSADTWFVIDQQEATFTITAAENSGNESRQGTITIALTDLIEGSYSLTMKVTQLCLGHSFMRDNYESDTDWDTFSNGSLTIEVIGFQSDTNWDASSDSSLTVNIDGYQDDVDYDQENTTSSNIDIENFENDMNYDE